jgi:hypothetical protein
VNQCLTGLLYGPVLKQLMKISYPQMDLLDHCFYYITLLQLLSSPVILLSLILTFTFEQSKGIVLYSQRNCGQESGMCIGIPLPMFLISIVIHISLGKCTYYLFPFGRSARSPLKLMSRFPDHPEIGTLHDSFVWALLLFLFKTSFKIHKVNV